MTTVVVVDDQVLVRQAVVDILDSAENIDVVGAAADGLEAVDLAASLQPDIVLMDIRMPRLDGIEATQRICADAANTNSRVLILTTFEEDEYVVSALRAGASGFIGKGAEPEEIIRAVHAVADGDELLSPVATRSLIAQYVRSPGPRPVASEEAARKLALLTEREREVLQLVGRGLSNQEIAETFFISPHTAKTHVNRIMTKIYAHDRAQLVILAYESGLLVPGE